MFADSVVLSGGCNDNREMGLVAEDRGVQGTPTLGCGDLDVVRLDGGRLGTGSHGLMNGQRQGKNGSSSSFKEGWWATRQPPAESIDGSTSEFIS